jgi:hypothetical protein
MKTKIINKAKIQNKFQKNNISIEVKIKIL